MTKVKSEKISRIKTGYEVPEGWVRELNFFDISGIRSKTIGSSSKMYHIELNVSSSGDVQIYTEYGPTGTTNPTKEWRYFEKDRTAAESEFLKIVKSKIKKGYKEIDVAQRSLGSTEAKKQTKAVILKNAEVIKDIPKSSLHPETQRLISGLMGATNQFVIKTLKCPIGQLTNNQIDKGRAILNEAKSIIAKKNLAKEDNEKIVLLTDDFYSLIPHNHGSGARGQMLHLLLDSQEKIIQKEYDLDTLLDAKDLDIDILNTGIDDQYRSLDTEFSFINKDDDVFIWLDKLIQETRAHNHKYLGRISLLNAWSIQRKGERDKFNALADKIATECGKQVYPDKMERLVKNRPDGNSDLFKKANVIPLFHGTRTENLTGILKKGLLIRPSGAIITGSMYGSGIYKSSNSTKSINYTSINSSYWAKGSDTKAYLFVSDCALGNTHVVSRSGNYTLNSIKPNHSVWAQGGKSGVINDEMILYKTDQHNMRYLLEFTCNK